MDGKKWRKIKVREGEKKTEIREKLRIRIIIQWIWVNIFSSVTILPDVRLNSFVKYLSESQNYCLRWISKERSEEKRIALNRWTVGQMRKEKSAVKLSTVSLFNDIKVQKRIKMGMKIMWKMRNIGDGRRWSNAQK